jgi:hypothetical protein
VSGQVIGIPEAIDAGRAVFGEALAQKRVAGPGT